MINTNEIGKCSMSEYPKRFCVGEKYSEHEILKTLGEEGSEVNAVNNCNPTFILAMNQNGKDTILKAYFTLDE